MDISPLLFIRMCVCMLRVEGWTGSRLDGHKMSVLVLRYLKLQEKFVLYNLNKLIRRETAISALGAIG